MTNKALQLDIMREWFNAVQHQNALRACDRRPPLSYKVIFKKSSCWELDLIRTGDDHRTTHWAGWPSRTDGHMAVPPGIVRENIGARRGRDGTAGSRENSEGQPTGPRQDVQYG